MARGIGLWIGITPCSLQQTRGREVIDLFVSNCLRSFALLLSKGLSKNKNKQTFEKNKKTKTMKGSNNTYYTGVTQNSRKTTSEPYFPLVLPVGSYQQSNLNHKF